VSVRRLTDADKRQIVDLYRTPGETAATLADQFGVSNTTIGRILKAGITVKEYDQLVQQKRRGNDSAAAISVALENAEVSPEPIASVSEPEAIAPPISAPPIPESTSDQRRSRRRSSAPTAAPTSIQPPLPQITPSQSSPYSQQLDVFSDSDESDQSDEEEMAQGDYEREALPEKTKKVIQIGVRSSDGAPKRSNDRPVRRSDTSFEDTSFDDEEDDEDLLPPVTEEIAAIMEEDFGEDEEETDDLDDEDDEDDLEDEGLSDSAQTLLSLQVANLLRVRPFEEADMPRTCYLVIDRAAELVVRPLGDFGDLGSLPEAKTMTLPIFDNHRVAKRFATDRTQRVIKVPDSQIFSKTAMQLRSKGITHLFVDGQIYSI
jgi:transposase-like protein